MLFWVDDRFEDMEIPSDDIWRQIFGTYPDHIFRFMDLTLEVASSYEEVLTNLEDYKNARETGTFVWFIIDLILPASPGTEPAIKYGVELAKQIKQMGFNFVFLSANADASSVLSQENLSTVPYYVKEAGKNPWKLPDSLAQTVLSEFRRYISWIYLDDVVEVLHPESEIVNFYKSDAKSKHGASAIRYFPFFSSFRDFVEHCEYRSPIDIRRSFVVRSSRMHCDLFVQQMLLIILYPVFLNNPEQILFRYGDAHDNKYIQRLRQINTSNISHTIDTIRVSPDSTSPDKLKDLLLQINNTESMTIIVIPNDETADQYTDVLQEFRLLNIQELPQNHEDDPKDRLELIRQTAALVFGKWSVGFEQDYSFMLPQGYINNAELLINPINWLTLLEAKKVAEDLSDPYEIVDEFISALNTMTSEQSRVIKESIEQAKPVPYEHMLRVGFKTFKRSEFSDELPDWIEQALDNWLSVSWHTPYGLNSRVLYQYRNAEGQLETNESMAVWEDASYEILVNIMAEYFASRGSVDQPTPRQKDLLRVKNFIDVLGGDGLLSDELTSVDWDALDLLRWPHMRYPMPSAIKRRLQQAGRYLWIQPEGLDLAALLPTGRKRYRMLIDTVDHYWSVIEWGQKVAEKMPAGWKESAGFLFDIIQNHRIEQAWMEDSQRVWDALKSLMYNARPVSFICGATLRKQPISGANNSIQAFLSSVYGCGKLLGRIRGNREHIIGKNLFPAWNAQNMASEIEKLAESGRLIENIADRKGDGLSRSSEMLETFQAFLSMISRQTGIKQEESKNFSETLHHLMCNFFYNSDLVSANENQNWYIDDMINPVPQSFSNCHIRSMLGTKLDFFWKVIDVFTTINFATHRYRYFDGYHFLAVLNDLRNQFVKEVSHPSPSDIPLHLIETVIDLFMEGFEGLAAQLSWCVELAGEEELAADIAPPNVFVQPPKDFKAPSPDEIGKIMRVKKDNRNWTFYTIGIPGEDTVNKYACFNQGSVCKI
ncbi:MAG: hypothetical protein ACOC90_00010 [Bacteroidota bacterium]